METNATKPVILYAEDDLDDFESVREALSQLTDQYAIINAKNGEEAIGYLKGSAIAPGLVVLDLNMPVMDGKEVVQWLNEQSSFRDIPVMVFTTSSREEDIKMCQKYHCTFYRKPTLYRDLLHIVQMMMQMCKKAV